jgi:hypothetical protein
MGEPALALPPRTNVYDMQEFCVVPLFGASVVTSYFGKDVTFARNSAGNFTLTLPRPYGRIYKFNWGFQDASGAILFCVITSETVATDGKIIFETRTEAGTATDPTSGDKLFLEIGVSYNALNDAYAALT